MSKQVELYHFGDLFYLNTQVSLAHVFRYSGSPQAHLRASSLPSLVQRYLSGENITAIADELNFRSGRCGHRVMEQVRSSRGKLYDDLEGIS